MIRLYEKSLITYIEMLILTLSIISFIVISFFKINSFPLNYIILGYFILNYIILETNINKVDFTYEYKRPSVIFVHIIYIIRHLYYTVKKGYSLQLSLSFILLTFFLILTKEYAYFFIMILETIIFFLNYLLNKYLQMILKIICLIQLSFIFNYKLNFYIYLLIFKIIVILVYLMLYKYTNNISLKLLASESSKIPRSITKIFIDYITKNRSLFIIISIIVALIMYIFDKVTDNFISIYIEKGTGILLTKGYVIPSVAFVYEIYILLLHTFIGNNREENEIDKSRSELLQSSLIINKLGRFKASTIYFYSLIMISLIFVGMIGTIIISYITSDNKPSYNYVINNLAIIFLTFITGFMYYRKIELINQNYKSFLLNYMFLFIIIIMSVIISIISLL